MCIHSIIKKICKACLSTITNQISRGDHWKIKSILFCLFVCFPGKHSKGDKWRLKKKEFFFLFPTSPATLSAHSHNTNLSFLWTSVEVFWTLSPSTAPASIVVQDIGMPVTEYYRECIMRYKNMKCAGLPFRFALDSPLFWGKA